MGSRMELFELIRRDRDRAAANPHKRRGNRALQRFAESICKQEVAGSNPAGSIGVLQQYPQA